MGDDQHATYPRAIRRALGRHVLHRTNQYLNNRIEQDHRFSKRRTWPALGFFSFGTAQRMLSRYETMNLIRNGLGQAVDKGDMLAQVHFIDGVFGLTA